MTRIIIYALYLFSASLVIYSMYLLYSRGTFSTQLIVLAIGVVMMFVGNGLELLDKRLRKLEE